MDNIGLLRKTARLTSAIGAALNAAADAMERGDAAGVRAAFEEGQRINDELLVVGQTMPDGARERAATHLTDALHTLRPRGTAN